MNGEILGVFLAGFGVIAGFMYWMFSHLDADIKALSTKLDGDIKTLTSKIESDTKAQTERTDKLYNIIIDMLK